MKGGMDHPQTFENAEDTFMGMTKSQFGLVNSLVSVLAATLACAAIVLIVVVSSQRHHDFCNTVNTIDSSIRVVLENGIKQGKSELKDRKFAQYREQIQKGIAQSKQYERSLFANRPC